MKQTLSIVAVLLLASASQAQFSTIQNCPNGQCPLLQQVQFSVPQKMEPNPAYVEAKPTATKKQPVRDFLRKVLGKCSR